ncbi:MAG: hypothetical protein R2724_29610 [Bryobacterales bacterium]
MSWKISFQQRYEKIGRSKLWASKPIPRKYEVPALAQVRASYDGQAEKRSKSSSRPCASADIKRRQGKAGFANLQKDGVQIQVYVRKDEVGDNVPALQAARRRRPDRAWRARSSAPKTDELTVRAEKLEFLSKAVLCHRSTTACRTSRRAIGSATSICSSTKTCAGLPHA